MGRYVLGIDAGTESIRAGVYDERGRCVSYGTAAHKTLHRHPGWAEQSVEEWDQGMIAAIREALSGGTVDPADIEGIGLDGTSCTVVYLDEQGRPVRDAIIWMDIRSAAEADEIAACGDPALRYVGFNSSSPENQTAPDHQSSAAPECKVSPEWFPCKNLWVKRHEAESWRKAATIFEQTDWMVYRLTGKITASINTVSIRWFYNSREGGFPRSLYEGIGLGDIFDKLPERILSIGEVASGLSERAAAETGLRAGIPVAGGGADAFMGVIGVNALRPGKLALITGSSQLHICLAERELHTPGIFGSYPDAILPGKEVVEAGQISTGSIIKWFTTHFLNADLRDEAERAGISIYDLMNRRAEKLPPGAEGLVVLEHWQGNRTPWVDANSRGVIRGLTLKHGPAHLFRAIMEGVVYGTQVILQRMESGGVSIDEIIACGGATQSDLWMQIHADVTGKPISIPSEQQAVSLGSAIAAAVGTGIYPDLPTAASAMVSIARVIQPNPDHTPRYREYVRQYEATYHALKAESARLVQTLV